MQWAKGRSLPHRFRFLGTVALTVMLTTAQWSIQKNIVDIRLIGLNDKVLRLQSGRI